MSDLPNGWELLPLKDCVFFQEGPGLRKWQFGESGVPFLNIRTFYNGTIDKTKCQFVKLAEFTGKYEHFLLEEGDIVVSSSGTLGKLVVVRKQDLPLMLNTSVIRYRSLYPQHLLQSFLKLFLQSHHFFSQIQTAKTGSAILNYGPSHIKEMEIIVPPLNEQRRIVAKFEKLLSRVDATQARLATIPRILKRFRQSVLAAACSGRLTADWRDNEDRLEELPRSWSLIELGNLIADGPHNGLYKPQSFYGSGTPIVRIDAFYDGRITNWAELKRLQISNNEREQFALADEDILINRVNSPKFLGKSALIQMMPEASVYESNMMRLRLDDSRATPNYAILYLRSTQGLEELRKNAKHAVNQSSINQQDVKAVTFALPPLKEQQEIVRRVEALFKTADALEARYRTAKAHVDKLTQSILAKAFRGELVPQDPNDEPASELLSRVVKESAQYSSKRTKSPKT
jgi:type I restriction enzyme S subunit